MLGWMSRLWRHMFGNKAEVPVEELPPPPPAPVIYSAEEIFRPNDIPTVTHVDRSRTPDYAEIKYQLRQGGLISVWGDSKSGKTVLCLDVLKDRQPVLLSGKLINEEFHFWNGLKRRLEGTLEASLEDRYGLSLGRTEHHSYQFSPEEQQQLDRHVITDKWIASRRPVIVDDFHAVERFVRTHIIRGLKFGTDQGCTAVVISIPEETKEIIDSIVQGGPQGGEEIGRYKVVPAPKWSAEEISEIAVLGFRALNARIDRATIDLLTEHAYHNPLLMQSYCSRLCFDLGITRTLPSETDFARALAVAPLVINRTAQEFSANFNWIIEIEKPESWILKSGEKAGINLLILLALAEADLQEPVNLQTIRSNMNKFLVDTRNRKDKVNPNSPNPSTIAEGVTGLTKRMRERFGEKPPLIYDDRQSDEKNQLVYIAHPFFKVFLKWYLLQQYSGLLDLTGETQRLTRAKFFKSRRLSGQPLQLRQTLR